MTSGASRRAAIVLLIAFPLAGCQPLPLFTTPDPAEGVQDRRPEGMSFVDEAIEREALAAVEERFPRDTRITVNAFNGLVLLTGEAPSGEVRDGVAAIVGAQPGVRRIVNEIRLAPVATLTARAVDTHVTGTVKTRFLQARRFRPTHIRVLTDDGVVYLMGLVTKEEADAAADLAARTPEVKSVARVFETYPLPPAAEASPAPN